MGWGDKGADWNNPNIHTTACLEELRLATRERLIFTFTNMPEIIARPIQENAPGLLRVDKSQVIADAIKLIIPYFINPTINPETGEYDNWTYTTILKEIEPSAVNSNPVNAIFLKLQYDILNKLNIIKYNDGLVEVDEAVSHKYISYKYGEDDPVITEINLDLSEKLHWHTVRKSDVIYSNPIQYVFTKYYDYLISQEKVLSYEFDAKMMHSISVRATSQTGVPIEDPVQRIAYLRTVFSGALMDLVEDVYLNDLESSPIDTMDWQWITPTFSQAAFYTGFTAQASANFTNIIKPNLRITFDFEYKLP